MIAAFRAHDRRGQASQLSVDLFQQTGVRGVAVFGQPRDEERQVIVRRVRQQTPRLTAGESAVGVRVLWIEADGAGRNSVSDSAHSKLAARVWASAKWASGRLGSRSS